ncbi:unnamed protein product [Sphagnum troendelagicum]|uniref:PPPDE domain-containing protein n=1 Tax=Sphagnum troendelagicum TaxID=128251 RepID=A0ABP0TVG3_9BRYO
MDVCEEDGGVGSSLLFVLLRSCFHDGSEVEHGCSEGVKVELYVYDLSQGMARQLSLQFLGKAIDGVWHTGVGVYGKEYFFGGGIQSVPLGRSPYGVPVQVIDLGYTEVPKDYFEEYLDEIRPRFTHETYNIVHHNCNNFSDEVSQFLVGSGIPQHILHLPAEVLNSPMGAMLRPMLENLESTLRVGAVPSVPRENVGQSPATPNFANIQLPSALPTPSRATTSAVTGQLSSSGLFPHPSIPSGIIARPPSEASAVMGLATKKSVAPPSQDALSNARAQVQEEITREFASIMASGSLRASEAAALAARRVLQRHGIRGSATSSQA